ncbi:MAG: DUF6691 family protein [Myxococcota bacterium]
MSGTIFGVGLAVSQMTNPAKVIAFLDLTGDWDPSLVVVMVAALVVASLGQLLHRRRAASKLENRRELAFGAAAGGKIDSSLIGGAALFGIGWGLSGFCPGPSLASLVGMPPGGLLFVGSMVVGMGIHDRLVRPGVRRRQRDFRHATAAGLDDSAAPR